MNIKSTQQLEARNKNTSSKMEPNPTAEVLELNPRAEYLYLVPDDPKNGEAGYCTGNVYQCTRSRCVYKYIPETPLQDIKSIFQLPFAQKKVSFEYCGRVNYRTIELQLDMITRFEAACFHSSIFIHIKNGIKLKHVLEQLNKPTGKVITHSTHILVQPASGKTRLKYNSENDFDNQLPDFILDNRTYMTTEQAIEFLKTRVNYKSMELYTSRVNLGRQCDNSLDPEQTLYFTLKGRDPKMTYPSLIQVLDHNQVVKDRIAITRLNPENYEEREIKTFYSEEFSFVIVEESPPAVEQ